MPDQAGTESNVVDCESLDRLAALLTGPAFRTSFEQNPTEVLAEADITGIPQTLIDYLIGMSSEELVAAAALAGFLRGFEYPDGVSPCFM